MDNSFLTKLSTSDSLAKHKPKPLRLSDKIVNPKRDWSILVVLLILFILGAIGFDYYTYQKIVSGDMYIGINRQDIVIENLNTKEMQKILTNFEIKKALITNIKPENLVDPSI